VLDGGPGGDRLFGGSGTDTASYVDRTQPVTATLDLASNDGEAGEGDDVDAGTENISGGAAADQLTGDGGANDLQGNGGGDTLDGQGGADTIEGGDGDDRIAARDGATDTITCGTGNDTVDADAYDQLAADCETVDRAVLPDPGPGGGPGLGPVAPLQLPSTVRINGNVARVKVRCPDSALGGCGSGLLELSARRKPVAHAAFSIATGDLATVSVHLSAKAQRKLAHRRRATLSASARGADSATAQVKIKRRKGG
jgi:Ca2+-binding RTX toxin-like protein